MTFWLLAVFVVLTVFAVVVLTASGAVSLLAPWIERRAGRRSPAARASLLFKLRLVPAAAASALAFGVALPIFLAYEPRDTEERLALTLVVLGAAGAALCLRGALRAVAAWRATAAVRRDWQARGRRVEGFDTGLPMFAIDEAFPTVAVLGISRPVLFISERVLRECPPEQVRAMLRHEAAHVAVRDNLKRFVMRACPDVLGQSSVLVRAWSSAAEEAADAVAAADRPAAALDLAEALIRVARLAPPRMPGLASAFYLGGSIESRVRRLLDPAPVTDSTSRAAHALLLAAAACTVVLLISAAPSIHQAMEVLVSHLP